MIRSIHATAAIVWMALMSSASHAAENVFEDFESSGYGDWKVEGEAFGTGPARGALPDQLPVDGFDGKGFVNSYHGGDDSTGKLVSTSFRIESPYIGFLIGGGDRDQACMNLIVDGKVVRSATASASERLEKSGWDVRDLRGKTARLEIVDDAKGRWGHINVDRIVFTDEKPPVQLMDASREIRVETRWLNFPIKDGGRRRVVIVRDGDEEVRRFDIQLADGAPDWWAPLDVSKWEGKTLTVSVNRLDESSQALASITNSETVPGTGNLYSESLRPQIHFSARRGWINDPNGLVFYNGEYHLFFQHNPYGWGWGNMHWGHAVSTDLVHWKELGEALYPDESGTMFSGCAVVDEKNTSGFGEDGKPPLLLYYTSAGRPFTLGLAYSTDGRTFTKYDGNPVVENFSDGNRDPKVYWHEPTGKWVMTFWGEEDGDNTLYFLNSPDGITWTRTSVLKGGKRAERGFLFECPDFFELPVDGDESNTKWVVFGGNEEYGIGRFDGQEFTMEAGPFRSMAGTIGYAAQTYANEPKDRRILVSWMRGAESPGMPFNQALSVPVELKLATTPEGVRMTHSPIDELESLRADKGVSFAPMDLEAGAFEDLPGVDSDLLELRAKFTPSQGSIVKIFLRGVPIVYDAAAQELSVDGVKMKARLQDGALDLVAYVDRTTVEVFASEGEAYIPIAVIPRETSRGVRVAVEGGGVRFSELQAYTLKSAWTEAAGYRGVSRGLPKH